MAYPRELGFLIENCRSGALVLAFEDAIFHAKFVVKSQEILRRIGPQGDGADKLRSEMETSLEKSITLVKTMVKEAPENVKRHFGEMFFAMTPGALSNTMNFLVDLSMVKNWVLDGHPLPFNVERPGGEARTKGGRSKGKPPNTRRPLVVVILLLIIFLAVEPPTSLLGWILMFFAIGTIGFVLFSQKTD